MQLIAVDIVALIGLDIVDALLEELQKLATSVNWNNAIWLLSELTRADFSGVLGVITAVNSIGAMMSTLVSFVNLEVLQ